MSFLHVSARAEGARETSTPIPPPPLASHDDTPGTRCMTGSADAWLLAESARTSTQPILVLTADTRSAARLQEEITWFLSPADAQPETGAAPADTGASFSAQPPLPRSAKKIVLLPDWETLPYDHFSPHCDLISERLATLWAIHQRQASVILVPVRTALLPLPPLAYMAAYTFFWKAGEALDLDRLRTDLAVAGYQAVSQVHAPGEFSVRGGVIDLFPMGSALPYRLDLFGDTLESIRVFDADTQRGIYPVSELHLLPAREFPLDEAGRTRFRARFREVFENATIQSRLYQDVSKGIAPPGIEYHLPLFFEQTATLFDYLGDDALLVRHGPLEAAAQHFWEEARHRHKLLAGDPDRPLLSPDALFLGVEALLAHLKPYRHPPGLRRLGSETTGPAKRTPSPSSGESGREYPENVLIEPLPDLQIDRRAALPLTRLQAFLRHFPGRVLIVAESLGRREAIAQYLAEWEQDFVSCVAWADFIHAQSADRNPGGPRLCVGPLAAGFMGSVGEGAAPFLFAILTENELYGAPTQGRTRRATRRASSVEGMLRDLSELKLGDAVVHEQHGIGRYRGLVMLAEDGSPLDDTPSGETAENRTGTRIKPGVAGAQPVGEASGASRGHQDARARETEMLLLEYADGAQLYVTVTQLHLLSRYAGGNEETIPLHRLGSGQWEKARRHAAEQVRDTAAQLLNLYARRAARVGYAFGLQLHEYDVFSAGFGFEETPDQQQAIAAVLADMQAGRPMDRLVCGDVGFGKTEVALRAAFVAVHGGKQVALLVPTTLLAEQHFQTFSDRFAGWPVKIVELSRFRSKKESTAALAGLADGTVDIAIGTHRLVQKDVHFKNLGLAIIDEEHRFGVRQKEQMKALRSEVDVLTLTATPIPRTLAMSLEGLRDFSVISTPPLRRLSVKTFVTRWSDCLIREAVMREMQRGGQVYFLYNQVDTIVLMQNRLAALLPEVRIAVAHGQMPERQLERVLHDFQQQRFHLLLCTTIIETGLDIPNANTIVIHRADRFGLAQLHQIRGRVGRSHHQAYAYLLVEDPQSLTATAQKRLEAIQKMDELGAGFYLAMHDLEIRGAGEVLGDEQSGEIQAIGFSLYSAMLERAVRALQCGEEPDLDAPLSVNTEVKLHAPALLPEAYCPDVHERLVLYKRLASCEDDHALAAMREELIDRFGLLPPAAQTLLECHRIRLQAQALAIRTIDAAEQGITLQFAEHTPLDPARVLGLIHEKRNWRLIGPSRLRVESTLPDTPLRIVRVKELLRELAHSATHDTDTPPPLAARPALSGTARKPS